MERSGGGGYPPRLLRKFPFNEGYISQFVLYRGIWPPPHIHTFYVVTPAPTEAPTYRKCLEILLSPQAGGLMPEFNSKLVIWTVLRLYWTS